MAESSPPVPSSLRGPTLGTDEIPLHLCSNPPLSPTHPSASAPLLLSPSSHSLRSSLSRSSVVTRSAPSAFRCDTVASQSGLGGGGHGGHA